MHKELLIPFYYSKSHFIVKIERNCEVTSCQTSHGTAGPRVHLITSRPCALNIPSHALPNVPMSKDHTDTGTGNTSVLGSYLVPRVIDLLDEELLLTYLKFNNLPMKSLLRIAQHKYTLPAMRSLAQPLCWLKCSNSFIPGHFIKISKIGLTSRK